ncbi:MAG: hypothetical protein POELPBGB_03597 [Bacteroidia bacterium]|nr:hypothetical protein [Bacteroidia bacterium]
MESNKENNINVDFYDLKKNPIVKAATIITAVVVLILASGGLMQIITYAVNSFKDLQAAYNR